MEIELPRAESQSTEHLPAFLFAEDHALAQSVGEPEVALNEESVRDPAAAGVQLASLFFEGY